MIYKPYKDISLSRLGMGNMRLPLIPGGKDSDIDVEKAQAIIDMAMAGGINYYDNAYVYHAGKSEEFLGNAMKKYPRDSFYLTTKYNVRSGEGYEEMFEKQLQHYQTDYIDFYLIHSVMDDRIDQLLSNGCIEYFLEQQAKGRIRYLGFSSHATPAGLDKFASHHQWDFAQIQLNYFDWLYKTAKEEYEVLQKHGLPVMVMESIRGGRLADLGPEANAMLKEAHPDWSIASWGFRWLKRLDGVQVCLSGMGATDQMADNLNTFADDRALTDEEEKILFNACDVFHKAIQVPCTACRYCCEGCPAEINIPEVLNFYNRYKLQGAFALNFFDGVKTKGQPKDCVACGNCLNQCPQSIKTPDIMAELADLLEKRKKR